MRRLHAVVVVVLLVAGTLALAGPVAADPPSTEVTEITEIGCAFESELGVIEFFAGSFEAISPEQYSETWGEVIIFESFETPPIVVTANPEDMTFGDGAFEGELQLILEDSGEPAGTAAVEGNYEAIGEPELVQEDRYRAGNRWEEIRVFAAPLVIAGSLEVAIDGSDSEEFDLASCEGQWSFEELWHTNPTAWVYRAEGIDLFCSLEKDGWFVEVFAGGEKGGGSFLDLVAWGPDAVPFEEAPSYLGFADDIGLSGFGSLFVEVPLWEPLMEEPTEAATIDAALSAGDVFNVDARFQDGWFKVVETGLVVEGTLTLPELSLDMSECEGTDFAVKDHFQPDRSQGKGKTPSNDLPTGAVELAGRTSIHTRMTAEQPEVSCVDPGFGELPLGKTVWYTVEGTGEELTVDTAGSDFDTIVGVYLMDGDELVQEACLDDNFDETGVRNVVALTFETMSDTTYYVQIGGFGGEYGHLKIALR